MRKNPETGDYNIGEEARITMLLWMIEGLAEAEREVERSTAIFDLTPTKATKVAMYMDSINALRCRQIVACLEGKDTAEMDADIAKFSAELDEAWVNG